MRNLTSRMHKTHFPASAHFPHADLKSLAIKFEFFLFLPLPCAADLPGRVLLLDGGADRGALHLGVPAVLQAEAQHQGVVSKIENICFAGFNLENDSSLLENFIFTF